MGRIGVTSLEFVSQIHRPGTCHLTKIFSLPLTQILMLLASVLSYILFCALCSRIVKLHVTVFCFVLFDFLLIGYSGPNLKAILFSNWRK